MLPGIAYNLETAGLFLGSDISHQAGAEVSSRRGSACSRSGDTSCSNQNRQLGTDLMRRGSSCSRIGSECSSLGDIAEDEIHVLQQGTLLTDTELRKINVKMAEFQNNKNKN